MLRQRVLSQLAGVALLMVLVFVGLYIFITQNYQHLERQNLELDRQRLLNALDAQIERLDDVIEGWAKSGYIEFAVANSSTDMFRNIGANIISGSFDINEVVFFQNDGQFVVGRVTDLEQELQDSPMDENSPFVAAAQSMRLFDHSVEQAGRRGLAMMSDKLHIVSAYRNESFSSEVGNSAVVAGSHFDDAAIQRLGEVVEQQLALFSITEFSSSMENLALLERMRASEDGAIYERLNDNEVHTYSLLNDFSGRPGFVLQATSDRVFVSETVRTLRWLGVAGTIAFFLLVVWFLAVLDRSVLRRLHSLNKSIMRVERSGELKTIAVEGDDEIGIVGKEFNRLILGLQKSQDELSFQANHDSLTGLINRRQFEQELDAALEDSKADGVERHLLFLDLDRFKIVNDSCGHIAGDTVLKELATLMGQQLGEHDIFARIGGDEFGIILPNCDSASARLISENIREIVSRFRYVSDGRQFMFGVSAGLLDLSSPAVDSRAVALTLADSACRIAKSAGRNRTHEHHVGDERLVEQRRQTQWVSRITDALENDRFVLYFQRIYSQQDGVSRIGAELLVRMRDEDGGIIAPGAFIPTAERYRLMGQIDRRVVESFLHWYVARASDLPELEFFTINLSGQSLADSDFLDFLTSSVQDSGVPGSKLCFEITETSIIENVAAGREFIKEMKALGCRFALDDFGAGMSSFVYLRDLPVDMVKIEGTFCQNMMTSEVDKAMVKSIIEISKLMNLEVVAECIEDEQVMNLCKEMGADYVQGFWLHRPEPLVKESTND